MYGAIKIFSELPKEILEENVNKFKSKLWKYVPTWFILKKFLTYVTMNLFKKPQINK